MSHKIKKLTADWLLAMIAGLCISLCGAVYFSCPNPIMGSFLFGLGLCTIIFFELKLYTGKVGYTPSNGPAHLIHLVWICAIRLIVLYFIFIRKAIRCAQSLKYI